MLEGVCGAGNNYTVLGAATQQEYPMLAILIFLLTYLLILAGENSPRKLDRPAAGMIGGVLMIATGVLTRREAAQSVDLGTLGLLFGMMVVIGFFVRCGLLDACAVALVRRSRSARHLLWVVVAAAGVLSALLVNDTICLLMTPLIVAVTRRAQLPAEPYLIALATSSNAGSVMTLTGNPGGWITRLAPLAARDPGSLGGLALFSAAATLGSNLFSNVPFVMLLRPSLAHLPHAQPVWLALAAASTLAGNLTLMGSVANMIVAQGAREACPLGFWQFARVGFLTTPLTVLASVVMLWLYACLGWAG
jgi:Na+/H+ antiporter NhaD/arsenite permease-like protein